jgi:hypothetical protein
MPLLDAARRYLIHRLDDDAPEAGFIRPASHPVNETDMALKPFSRICIAGDEAARE